MYETVTTILLATLPIVGILVYVVRSDRTRAPWSSIAGTFGWGLLGVIPTFVIAFPFLLVEFLPFPPLLASVLRAFLLAALPEETTKLIILELYCATRDSFNEPMDGLVYGAVAGLGFAVIEHILYGADLGMGILVIRAFLAVPFHAALGAITGYALARQRFFPTGKVQTWMGWAIAILLHGLYNTFFLYAASYRSMDGSSLFVTEILPFCSFLIAMGSIGWAVWKLRQASEAQALEQSGGPSSVPETVPGYLERLQAREAARERDEQDP